MKAMTKQSVIFVHIMATSCSEKVIYIKMGILPITTLYGKNVYKIFCF